MKNRNVNAGDNWKTPEKLYERLDKEFHFDFDPCPYSVDLYIPPERDGLKIEWGKCNYVNPPYSRMLKEQFVKRAVEMQKKGKTSVCLLPVSTSTELFHNVIVPNATEIRFLKGRVKFEGYNTKGEWVKNKCGMFDSMLVVFGVIENKTYTNIEVNERRVLACLRACRYISTEALESNRYALRRTTPVVSIGYSELL